MDANDKPQPMFPEEEFGRGMTREQKQRISNNIWVSMELARQSKVRKMQKHYKAN